MRILRGTIAGGVVFFLLGWLVYGVLLMGYMTANMNQCMARPMEEMVWWAMIASSLLTGLMLTMVLNWAGAKAIVDGVKTGAIFGVVLSSSIDLSFWSMTKMYNNFTVLLVDVVLFTAMMAAVGAIIVLLWGKQAAA